MKKNKKRIYIIEVILLIYILFYGIYVVRCIPEYMYYINISFWILFFMYLFLFEGFVKDRNYLKKNAIKIVIIVLLIYFLTTFLLGFFLGFSYGLVKINPKGSLLIALSLVIPYVFMELSRYMILKKNPGKIQIVFLTLLFIIINVIMLISNQDLSTRNNIFIVTSTIIVPTIANECLYTYLSYEVGYWPTIIYKIIIETYAYILPILPGLGNYLISITGVILPFITYVLIRKIVLYHNKKSINLFGFAIKYINIVVILFMVILVVLTSGIFKYQLLSIVSNSMNPVFYRGDAVLIIKTDPDEIEVGDVLVYDRGSGIITHRVVKITNNNGKRIFTTKGDNNEGNDNFEIYDSNVIGKVKYVLKYAGYPTIYIKEILGRK